MAIRSKISTFYFGQDSVGEKEDDAVSDVDGGGVVVGVAGGGGADTPVDAENEAGAAASSPPPPPTTTTTTTTTTTPASPSRATTAAATKSFSMADEDLLGGMDMEQVQLLPSFTGFSGFYRVFLDFTEFH